MMPTLPLLSGWASSHSRAAANLGRDVVGGAVAVPVVQVRADHGEPMPGQPVAELPVELVPAGHVMDGDDAAARAVAVRPGNVGVDLVAITGRIGDHLGADSVAFVRPERVPHARDPSGSVASMPLLHTVLMAAADRSAEARIDPFR
jgi:hypothetical protein